MIKITEITLQEKENKNAKSFSIKFDHNPSYGNSNVGDNYFSILIGPNGCGKSTIINALVNFFREIGPLPNCPQNDCWLKVCNVKYNHNGIELDILQDKQILNNYFSNKYIKAFCFGMFCEAKIQDNYKYKLIDELHNALKAGESNRILVKKPFNLKRFVSYMLLDLFSIDDENKIDKILRIFKIDYRSASFKIKITKTRIDELESKYYNKYPNNNHWNYIDDIWNKLGNNIPVSELQNRRKIEFLYQLVTILGSRISLDFFFKMNNFGKEKVINFSNLSSGELSLLSCLVSASTERNSIIFIDEPEINLHPNWQMEFIQNLDTIAANNNNHFIIATHSHFLVSSLPLDKGEIISIKKDDEGQITAKPFQSSTFGWSAEQVLLDVFETPTDRNRYLADMISDNINKLEKGERLNENDVELLKRLANNLKEIDPLKGIILALTKD